jgi:hypothetical protein
MISALLGLVALSVFAQSSPTFRTSKDVREGVRGSLRGEVVSVAETRNQFTVRPDDARYGDITVQGDSVSTVYSGFGGVINGAPEIFQGSQGISNVRENDRVEVRGVGQANNVINAEQVVLLGRKVPADQVGVGQTRMPTSPSSPTAGRLPGDAAGRIVEGIVQKVNTDDNRVVIETDHHELITVRGTSSTPVYYRQDIYRIANLETGDKVRVQADSSVSSNDIRARSIEVMQNIQEPSAPKRPQRDVGMISGRVSWVERGTTIIRVQPDTGRGTEVRVDLANAVDGNGTRIRPSDLQAGDRVSISGTSTGDIFRASTVSLEAGSQDTVDTTLPPPGDRSGTLSTTDLGLVTIYGSVSKSLATSPQLVIRDQNGNRNIPIYAADDLVVRGRGSAYTTADRLKEGDSVVVKAFRDANGNYIAQTVRVR